MENEKLITEMIRLLKNKSGANSCYVKQLANYLSVLITSNMKLSEETSKELEILLIEAIASAEQFEVTLQKIVKMLHQPIQEKVKSTKSKQDE
jgi:hypothetical protein